MLLRTTLHALSVAGQTTTEDEFAMTTNTGDYSTIVAETTKQIATTNDTLEVVNSSSTETSESSPTSSSNYIENPNIVAIGVNTFDSLTNLKFYGATEDAAIVQTIPDELDLSSLIGVRRHRALSENENIVRVTERRCNILELDQTSHLRFDTDKPVTINFEAAGICEEDSEYESTFIAPTGSRIVNMEFTENGSIKGVLLYNPVLDTFEWTYSSVIPEEYISSLLSPDGSEMHRIDDSDSYVDYRISWTIEDSKKRDLMNLGFDHWKAVANFDNQWNDWQPGEETHQTYESCVANDIDADQCIIGLHSDPEDVILRSYSSFCVYPMNSNDEPIATGTCHTGNGHEPVLFVGTACSSDWDCGKNARCRWLSQGVEAKTSSLILSSTFEEGICNTSFSTSRLCYTDRDCLSYSYGWGLSSLSCINNACSDIYYYSPGSFLFAIFIIILWTAIAIGFCLCCATCCKIARGNKKTELPPPLVAKDRVDIPSFRQDSQLMVVSEEPITVKIVHDNNLPSEYPQIETLQSADDIIHAPLMTEVCTGDDVPVQMEKIDNTHIINLEKGQDANEQAI